MTGHHPSQKGAWLHSSPEAREDQRPISGEEAVALYREWRKRHLQGPDADGNVWVRLIPKQRRETRDSNSG